MLKFTERPKTPGITSKKTGKNMAFPEGNNLFAGDLCVTRNKRNKR